MWFCLPLLRLHPHLLRRGTVSRSFSLTCRWSADIQIVTSWRGVSADVPPCWCSPSLLSVSGAQVDFKTLTCCAAPQLGFSPPLGPSVWKPDLHRGTVISRLLSENNPLWWCWKRMMVPWWCPLGVGSLLTASLWCTCLHSGCEKTLIRSDRKVFFSNLSGWRWPFLQVWGGLLARTLFERCALLPAEGGSDSVLHVFVAAHRLELGSVADFLKNQMICTHYKH